MNNEDFSSCYDLRLNKLGFIGSGKMANAIIKGVINSNLYKADSILVSDINKDSLTTAHTGFGVTPVSCNIELAKKADIIIIAVKPFVIKNVLQEIKPHLTLGKLIISIIQIY